MTERRHSRLAVVTMAALVLAVRAAAQNNVEPAADDQTATAKRVIVVSLEDRKLALIEDGKVVKVYAVAVGKPSTPSPTGSFTIARRVMNPTYTHDGRTVPPGPGNPVGSRWMGLSIPGYGIHGTNEPRSIGKAASHGCIRMAKADLEELYPMVAVGDTVELVGHRDEETAQLFGLPESQSDAKTEMARATPGAAMDRTVAAAAPQTASAVQSGQAPVVAGFGLDALTRDGITVLASLALAGSL